MAELERSKGGKDSKKVKRARRRMHKGTEPRVHHKTTSLQRKLRKGQVYDDFKRQGRSPFEMPFDSVLCRMFAFMRAQGLSVPRK